jgi:hypothetical protein
MNHNMPIFLTLEYALPIEIDTRNISQTIECHIKLEQMTFRGQ